MNNPNNESSAPDAAPNPPSSPGSGPPTLETGQAPPPEQSVEGLPEVEPLTPELVEDEAIRGDFMLRWAVVLLAFLMACTEIAESRTLVHVKTGQYIASNGMLPPRHDVFSYTATERPWVNTAWLFDLLLAGVYTVTGALGLTLLKALVAGTAFALVVHTSRSGISTWWGSICAALGLLVCMSQFHALPEIFTLLGIALELWLLNQWREKHETKTLWQITILMLVWGNLDPRMFLGIALLVLYALGQSLGRLFARSAASTRADIGRLWLFVAVSIVVAMINPFGWNTLTAPATLYGIEYPTMRSLSGDPVSVEQLPNFPLVSSVFWKSFSYHTLAGIILAVAALVSLALNWDEVDMGDVFLFLGFSAFAMAASHELGPASIVFAAIATWNAQAWYSRSFRQTYSIETTELLFSRGGRAATVIALFVLAYLSISGHIGGERNRRTGFGWHGTLQSAIEGMAAETEDAFDDRPFNTLLRQGDVLIWTGQKVFIDTRVALYTDNDGDSLLAQHRATRTALQGPQLSDNERKLSAAEQAAIVKLKLDQQKKDWKQVFDRYGLTHVLVDISGGKQAIQGYQLLYDLAATTKDWQQTSLGAVTASFYRKDLANPKLKQYLASHNVQPRTEAFEQEAGEEEVLRPEWARARTFYDKYLSLPASSKSNDIRKAEHYTFQLERPELIGRMTADVGTASAYLAIRNANEGLSDNPQSAEGYYVLASAYQYLDGIESLMSRREGGTYLPTRRWYQAIAALNQALTIAPEYAQGHLRLYDFYARRQKFDLALREVEAYEKLTANDPIEDEFQQRLKDTLAREADQFRAQNDRFTGEVQKFLSSSGNVDRLQLAQTVYQQGFVLLALQVLENDASFLSQNIAAQLLQSVLLLESGATEKALDVLLRVQLPAQQQGINDWRIPTAYAQLGNGNYKQAVSLFQASAKEIEDNRWSSLLSTVPMIASPDLGAPGRVPEILWPSVQYRAATVALLQMPEQIAQNHFDLALCQLEMGKVKEAADEFHKTLAIAPETGLRPIVAFYLSLLTKETMDPRPFAERIPVSTDLFVDGPGDAYAKGTATKSEPTEPAETPKPSDAGNSPEPAKSPEATTNPAPPKADIPPTQPPESKPAERPAATKP